MSLIPLMISQRARFYAKNVGRKSNFAFKYLTDVMKENSSVKIYGEPIEIGVGYTTSMNALLLMQPERFNFDSETEMLIVAIHILTLNYPEKII
jgi:hypothetical protein